MTQSRLAVGDDPESILVGNNDKWLPPQVLELPRSVGGNLSRRQCENNTRVRPFAFDAKLLAREATKILL